MSISPELSRAERKFRRIENPNPLSIKDWFPPLLTGSEVHAYAIAHNQNELSLHGTTLMTRGLKTGFYLGGILGTGLGLWFGTPEMVHAVTQGHVSEGLGQLLEKNMLVDGFAGSVGGLFGGGMLGIIAGAANSWSERYK